MICNNDIKYARKSSRVCILFCDSIGLTFIGLLNSKYNYQQNNPQLHLDTGLLLFESQGSC